MENKNWLWWQKPDSARRMELNQLIGKAGPIARLTFPSAPAFPVGQGLPSGLRGGRVSESLNKVFKGKNSLFSCLNREQRYKAEPDCMWEGLLIWRDATGQQ